MNYIGLNTFDTANGPGVRVSLFVSGCTLHCKGCFNQDSWDFKAGKPFTEETVQTILNALDNKYVDGLSILGGDPLEQENLPTVASLCRKVKEKFGESKTIWLWTGRRYEQFKDEAIWQDVDVLIDGPYIEKYKAESAPGMWWGSLNQRMIRFNEWLR